MWRASRRVAKLAGVDIVGRPALHAHRHTMSNVLGGVTDPHVRSSMIGHAGEESGDAYRWPEREEKTRAAGKVVVAFGRKGK